MKQTPVGTSRCDVPARASAGGRIAPLHAARTARRAVPTWFRGSRRESVREILSLSVFLLLLLASARLAFGQTEVVVDFEKAEITGRWIESWEEKGVVFMPAHAPVRGKAKARLMFFPHLPSGRKGILSAMADDPIPVRVRFPAGASLVTIEFWGSTGCAARLDAYDAEGKLVDKASLDVIPGRKAPGDPIPTFALKVKANRIAYVEFSGPRVGEYLAAEEVRFVPFAADSK